MKDEGMKDEKHFILLVPSFKVLEFPHVARVNLAGDRLLNQIY